MTETTLARLTREQITERRNRVQNESTESLARQKARRWVNRRYGLGTDPSEGTFVEVRGENPERVRAGRGQSSYYFEAFLIVSVIFLGIIAIVQVW